MNIHSNKRILRSKRQKRIRAKISGTADRPRLAVFRSNTRLSVQLIDDVIGKTIASKHADGKNIIAAQTLGTNIAALAIEKGITRIVFDRGGYQYHGTIKALADAARAGGLQF